MSTVATFPASLWAGMMTVTEGLSVGGRVAGPVGEQLYAVTWAAIMVVRGLREACPFGIDEMECGCTLLKPLSDIELQFTYVVAAFDSVCYPLRVGKWTCPPT